MYALPFAAILLIGGATPATAQTPPDGPPPGPPRGGRVFISPMGEPFRGGPGGDAPHDQWFARVDADHDGALSPAEMEADAARFFALLDRQKDGEIDPDDIEQYETVLAPEIRGAGMGGGPGGGGPGGGGKGRGGPPPGGDRRGGGGFGGNSPGGNGGGPGPRGGGDPNGGAIRAVEGKQGAARFGYLDFPEPVTSADRNMNRGIDAAEFRLAADTRFKLLDTNGDGRIEKGELPRLAQRGMGPIGGRPGARQDVPRPRD